MLAAQTQATQTPPLAVDLRPLTDLAQTPFRWRDVANQVIEMVNQQIHPLRMTYGVLEVPRQTPSQSRPVVDQDRLLSNPNLVLMSDEIKPVKDRPGHLRVMVTDLPVTLETVAEAVIYKQMAGYGRRMMLFLMNDQPTLYLTMLNQGELLNHLQKEAGKMAREIRETYHQLMANDPPMSEWERMMKPSQLFRQAEMMTLERWLRPTQP